MNKGMALLAAGRLAQALLSVTALRVMTALLSPEEVGHVFLVLAFAGGFGLFLVNPVGMYINRKLHAWRDRGTLLPHFSLFNLYLLAAAGLAAGAVLLARSAAGVGTGIPAAHFAGVIALYVYANSWNMTLVPALNLLGHRGLFVSLSVLTSALGLALSAAFAFKVSAEGAAWLAGQALGFAALGAAAFLALKRLSGEAFPAPVPSLAPEGKESFRDLRSFAAPLAAATFFLWLQTQSYRLIVERLAGAEFLGFLAVGLGIASSLAAVAESLVQQFYFPGFYSRLSSGGPEERREALAALYARSIPVYLVLAAFTAALSGQLTGLLVAPEFAGASAFVVFGAFIELFRMSSNIFAAAAHSEMRTAALVKPYAVGGLFTAAAVAAACFLPQREALIPAAMLAGGAVTFAAIRTHSSRLVSVPLSGALLLRALLFSAVFVLFLPARELTSPLQSALLIAAGGIYFLFASWRLSAAGPAGEGE